MNNKKIICIVVALGVALSWYMGITNALSENSGYDAFIRTAKEYESEQLYGKAISDYKSALTYEDTLELRLKIIEMYKAGIQIGEVTSDGNLVAMLLDTMTVYHDRDAAYEAACEYFYSILNYDELINALKLSEKNGIGSSKIKEIRSQVRYLYEKGFSHFSEPVNLTNGYYIIKDIDNHYSINHELDTHVQDCEFVTPYSADGLTVVRKAGKVFIMNTEGIRQKYLDEKIVASSGISDGKIACKVGDKWAYYNTDGEKISADYIYASRFSYGVAAVQTEAGKWQLVNLEFKPLTDTVFEDVKLNSAEECAAGNVVLAKTNGKYNLIKVKDYAVEAPLKVTLETVKDFSCIDCDTPVDPIINGNKGEVWFAFKEEASQKWGFADCEGKITISPSFVQAKSFSNGYAAVYDGKVWNYANAEGNVVINTNVTGAGYFNPYGYCMVQFEGGFWTYIRMYLWE